MAIRLSRGLVLFGAATFGLCGAQGSDVPTTAPPPPLPLYVSAIDPAASRFDSVGAYREALQWDPLWQPDTPAWGGTWTDA